MIAIAVAAGCLLTGCSVLAVRDAHRTPTGQVVCDAAYAPPVIDTLVALAGASLIVWGALAETDDEGHSVTAQNFAALPGILIGLPFSISALHGYAKVGRCKAAAERGQI
jgi:hypothetical protein